MFCYLVANFYFKVKVLYNKYVLSNYTVVFNYSNYWKQICNSFNIKSIGNKYYSARGKKLDKIINEIKNNRSFRATLGGCIIEKVNQTVIISKEH